ncbi:hypothetical protein B2J93_5777 [Marssonina coronariae]|uniref:Uncharacterized protein n=1 Tax=Diplocarpon coronariae TaxID=2795749 RepID=A0A218YWM8_9HELO|nr:hypothetical protein B2J93_5777 [Marssonina coronariae]
MAIKKIELRDGKTLVYDDKGRDADRRDLEQWWENEERLVFLARFACSDSVSWMFGVVEYVLQGEELGLTIRIVLLVPVGTDIILGTVSEIREVVIVPKNPTRRLPTVCTNGEENPSASMAHQLFRLKLSGIHDFALDLSGAQYGCYSQVSRWDEYCKERVQYLIVKSFPCSREVINSSLNSGVTETVISQLNRKKSQVSGAMLPAIKEWEERMETG